MSESQPMAIYQPVLFVGLGGTGCRIGAELERRMREELCGADGRALVDRVTDTLLPFQLPACVQFVYADLNEAELSRVRSWVVGTEEHAPAADRTQHLTSALIPAHNSYPEVANSLRMNVSEAVRGWLPPPTWEPKVNPLSRGAGQLPTVGRAALFETFRHGAGAARRPIDDAIGLISKSGGQLAALGGRLRGSCDVFVAFSVAGGTGSGIFFDYLHLIGKALADAGYQKAKIYPLVLMPSAFEDGMGGGRNARLNAGRALLDLFRLVDDQNARGAETRLRGAETRLTGDGTTGALTVSYPVEGDIRLGAGTVQTAFLFSHSPGVERDDLHRSVVSLMLSLIATDLDPNENLNRPADQLFQSFADNFVNHGVEREMPAPSGVGNCGVSTGLVASMTVPVDDLADIVGSRLLAEAVNELAVPAPGRSEVNRALIEAFFTASELDGLRLRLPLGFNEPPAAKGAAAITRALLGRVRVMEASVDALDRRLPDQASRMALAFNPDRAVDHVLGETDLFRLRRVILGDPRLADEVGRLGFAGGLERRRGEPTPPEGVRTAPPQPKRIKNRFLRRATWNSRPVQETLALQDAWYGWRTKRAWHAAWAEQTSRWEPKVRKLRHDVEAITDAFLAHAQQEPSRRAARVNDLYRPRTGVSYLLPPQGTDLELFYQVTRRRYVQVHGEVHRLPPAASPAQIVSVMLGADMWRLAYTSGVERGPERALALVRDRIKQIIKQLFRHEQPGEQPLLPALADLLTAAAGSPRVPIDKEDLTQFEQKIAALVPGGFAPQGSGPMKVLMSYSSGKKDPAVESYLDNKIYLARTPQTTVDFRPVNAESITVVFFRTSMSVTEVPELCDVLREWAKAETAGKRKDFLPWRQRLGYDFGYLMTAEEHRVRILHRILCALWNGQVTASTGEPSSPEVIDVRLGPPHAPTMDLHLTSYARASSWGSLLRAYEEWTIADDQLVRREFCEQLMQTLPDGLSSTPNPPHELYRLVIGMAAGQVKLLDELQPRLPEGGNQAGRLRRVWAETLPAALDMPFEAATHMVAANLRDLEDVTRQ